MNRVVCFKIIPDLSGARMQFSCYEETALELALGLGPGRCTALTVDTDRADLFLRHLYAVGYDAAVRVAADGLNLDFNPGAVARILAAVVRQDPACQVVLLGPRSTPGDHCQTGYLLAGLLGWPCFREVIHLEAPNPDALSLTCRKGSQQETRTLSHPVVGIVGNSVDTPYLRIPTLRQKLGAAQKKVLVQHLAALGLDATELRRTDQTPVSVSPLAEARRCVYVTDMSALCDIAFCPDGPP